MTTEKEIGDAFSASVAALEPLSQADRSRVLRAVAVLMEGRPKGSPRKLPQVGAPQVGDLYDTHETARVVRIEGAHIHVEGDVVSGVTDAAGMAGWTRVAPTRQSPTAEPDDRT